MYWAIVFSVFLVNICYGADLKPWEPQGNGSPAWGKKHQSFLKHTAEFKNETKVVFIGASITEFWQNEGKEIWNSYYVNRSAVDYGIGGDTTSNVLWRIQNHELDGLKPRVIVLQIGYNDFHAYKPAATDAEIAQGVIEVVKHLRTKCPESKVLNIGLLPVKDKKLDTRVKIINELVAKHADNKHSYFLDLGPHLVDSDGNQKTGIFREGIHLTAAGYQIWHQTMKPLFEKLYLEPEE